MKSHASMNRIYRLVFNAVLGIWVAVAENAKGRGKGGRAACALIAVLAIISPSAYAANAADASVVVGTGSVSTSGLTTTINQTSQRLAIDWTQLSTAANEALRFNQPNAQAIALNRITGSNPSSFLGSLTANGQVFILNPNGVLFGAGSQVNVGGLVASTLAMSNADFQAGRNVFTNSGGRGSVVNQGTMTAAQGGYLALLAPEVRNEGVMTASLGTALLAAGNKVTLNLDNGSLLGYSIDQGAINALAENKQLIKADGGQVLLSARAMDALTTAAVNNTGVIEARTLQNKAGRIMLMGDMEHGTVNVGGTLDASAPDGGNGGFIETSAAHVKVATGTRVTTRAAAGQTGKWLIDPNDFTISATGDMDAATVVANLATTNFEIQTATMGTAGNGDIHVNEALTWSSANTLTLTAERNINISQAITATNGGLTLNAVNQITAPAAVSVGTFTLTNGKWSQLGALPAFSATDFRINGGTFIRALGGDGLSTGTAYQLTDVYGLQGAGSVNMLNKHYKLANDIDASGTATWNGGVGGAGFKPIGDDFNLRTFSGSMNGQNHVISNLTINRPTTNYVGLFGMAVGGSSVSNLGLAGGSITGRSSVGAMMGRNYLSSISNSYSSASVVGILGGVGGLVGYNNSTITNSYASGTVNGTNAIGGLVGVNYGDITNSYASGVATGTSSTGAMVGDAQGGNITASFWQAGATPGFGYNGATVDGLTRGLTNAEFNSAATYSAAGWNASSVGGDGKTWRIYEGQTGPLLRSYLTAFNLTPTFDGSASSPANIGAYSETGADPTKLLGAAAAASDKLTLSNTGAAGSYTATVAAGRYSHQQGYDLVTHRVITTASSAAGDVRLDNNISFTNGTLALSAANNIDLNGAAIASASGRLQIDSGTAINMGSVNVDVFNMAGGSWRQISSTPAVFAVRDFGISGGTFMRALGGDGLTTGTAYQLTDVYGLQGVGSAGMLDKNYKLANNIDAFGTAQWNNLAGFKPIGDNINRYSGAFDGNNKTISNLTIVRPTEDYVGLFGVTGAGSSVKDVGLDGINVKGAAYVGGLAGVSNGSISNSYVAGIVDAYGNAFTGGLVGYSNASITNSHATGSVRGGSWAGGLVGYSTASISGSYATSNVNTDGAEIGGLVGYSTANISDSFATGNVTAVVYGAYMGGLVGRSLGSISNSYATGTVYTASGNFIGGLVGNSTGNGGISNSYATGSVSGTDYVGGLVGFSDGLSSITNSYATGVTTGVTAVGSLVGRADADVNASFWLAGATPGIGISNGAVDGLTRGLTNAEFQSAATYTAANWSASNVGGDGKTWRVYEGQTGPLLRSFLTPLNMDLAYDGNGAALANAGAYSTPGTADATKLFGTAAAPGVLTLASSGTAGNYLARAPVSGVYSNQAGYDILPTASRTIATAGSAVGDVRLDNGITWTNGTLVISAANNINLNGNALASSSGTLQLNGGTAINAGGVNVDLFNMTGGTWQQVSATPAAFAARDFGISGGTFIRALGGDGLSPGTAYQLTDVYGLQGAGSVDMLNKHYKLANDIDASGTANWNGGAGGAGFKPIGDDFNLRTFSGSMNGQNHVISNLTINRPTTDYVGLFGVAVGGGSVSNLGLAGGSITGRSSVGALMGSNQLSSISNSYSSANVIGILDGIGGLVGENNSTIINSYASGTVNGTNAIGGLVGINYGDIINSYATGVTAGTSNTGALVGDARGGNITASFWQGNATPGFGYNDATVDGFTRGLTTTEFKSAATFTAAGWNASNVGGDSKTWRIYEGQTGPLLRSFMTGLTLADTTVTYNGGTQLGATTADARVLGGSNASARNAGSSTHSYYSSQQGVDISGGALTIGKANLVLASSDVSKTYDGDTSALGTAVITGGTQLFGTDTVGGGSFAFLNKNAGAGNKAVSTTGVTVNDGNSGNNYNVSYVNNTTSTITPKALTVSGLTADNKTYDQGRGAAVNTGSAVYTGLISGDALAVNATGLFADKNAANGKTVTLTSGYTGADVNNYIITSQATTTANITPKALTVSGIIAANKIYDQGMSATVSATGAVLGGFIAGDVLAVNATGVFLDKNAATGKTVNLTSNYTGADVGNYAITDQTTTTANIGKLAIVGNINGQDKVYDGNTTATIGFRNLTGVISGDAVTYSGGVASFGDKNAGIAKAITATGLSLTGTDAGNYTVNSTATSTGDIDKANLTVTAAAQNKIYDATTVATLAYTDNRIAGDSLSFISSASFSDKNVGTAKTVNYTGLTQSGTDAGNYTLISATSGTSNANITPAALSITANNDSRLAGPAYSGGNGVVYTGLVGGETASVLTGAPAYSGSSQGASAAGSYAITPGGQAGSNYAITFNNGVLTLRPASAAASALGDSKLSDAYTSVLAGIAGAGKPSGGGNGGNNDEAAGKLNAAAEE